MFGRKAIVLSCVILQCGPSEIHPAEQSKHELTYATRNGLRQKHDESCGSYLFGILPVSALHACPHIRCCLDYASLHSSETVKSFVYEVLVYQTDNIDVLHYWHKYSVGPTEERTYLHWDIGQCVRRLGIHGLERKTKTAQYINAYQLNCRIYM